MAEFFADKSHFYASAILEKWSSYDVSQLVKTENDKHYQVCATFRLIVPKACSISFIQYCLQFPY